MVDNGSTDGTVEMVEHEFPDIRLIKLTENTGVAAYNLGMRYARGEIVVVSDNDSWLEPDGIAKFVEKFQNGSSDLAIIACEIIYIPKNTVYQWHPHPVDKSTPRPDGYPTHLFIGAGAAIKKSVLEEVGYYPEEFFFFMNEVDLCTRVIGAGYDIRYCPDIVAYHKGSPFSRAKSLGRLLSFRNIIWYYWKYFPIHIAFGRSLIRIPFEIFLLLAHRTNPFSILRTLAEIFWRLPEILKKRNPIPKRFAKKALGNQSEIANLYCFIKEAISRRRKASDF